MFKRTRKVRVSYHTTHLRYIWLPHNIRQFTLFSVKIKRGIFDLFCITYWSSFIEDVKMEEKTRDDSYKKGTYI